MKVLLPYHLGAGNRGCEGIARGISSILDLKHTQLLLFDISEDDYQLDTYLGLNEIGELICTKQNKKVEVFRLICRLFQKIGISFFYNQLMSSYYVNKANLDDLIFITGGDIYCYKGGAKLPNLIVKKAKRKGVKTVLFGASVEEKLLNERIINGLKNYDLIITRETISFDTLTILGLKNYLYPDPAFFLNAEPCFLPDFFQKKVVGINFSPFTDTSNLFNQNICNLIDYILETGREVCLIPHVFWKGQDDRDSINYIANKYQKHVHVIDSENMSYLQIRYLISKCTFFIGGRTHSVISAYSTHVPCLALGYSIKSKGIAKDIGLPDYSVIDSNHLKSDKDVLEAFIQLEHGADEIIQIYNDMDRYISRLNDLKNFLFDKVN